MTELKVILPDSLAREARKAGLLTQKAIGDLLREAMRRRAARAFLSNAKAVAQAKIPLERRGDSGRGGRGSQVRARSACASSLTPIPSSRRSCGAAVRIG